MSTRTKYHATFYLETEPLPQLVCPVCGGYIPTPVLATPHGVILCQCEPSGIIDSTAQVLPLEEKDATLPEVMKAIVTAIEAKTGKRVESFRELRYREPEEEGAL